MSFNIVGLAGSRSSTTLVVLNWRNVGDRFLIILPFSLSHSLLQATGDGDERIKTNKSIVQGEEIKRSNEISFAIHALTRFTSKLSSPKKTLLSVSKLKYKRS